MIQLVNKFNTKREALNFMQVVENSETTLVNRSDGWFVVRSKEEFTVEGECSETNIQTS